MEGHSPEIEQLKTSGRFSNFIKLVIKLVVTGLCLWYVSSKIDWQLTWQLLVQSNKVWLVIAAALFALSKVVAAFRLNEFFRNIEVSLSQRSNLALYWLGMFYNLFLPGGIGGDAYKVILLNQRFKHSAKKLSAAVLLDRISGVAGLGIIAVVYYFAIFRQTIIAWWLIFAIIPGIAIFYYLVKKVFPSFLKSFWNTLWLGIVVQVLQVLCIYAIMESIQIGDNQSEYVLLFLLSSVVAILPFTIGGLGAREVVFLWGSQQFLLDSHQSVYISILFYLITVLISFIGIRWVYKSPVEVI